jgi:hypothetical protein
LRAGYFRNLGSSRVLASSRRSLKLRSARYCCSWLSGSSADRADGEEAGAECGEDAGGEVAEGGDDMIPQGRTSFTVTRDKPWQPTRLIETNAGRTTPQGIVDTLREPLLGVRGWNNKARRQEFRTAPCNNAARINSAGRPFSNQFVDNTRSTTASKRTTNSGDRNWHIEFWPPRASEERTALRDLTGCGGLVRYRTRARRSARLDISCLGGLHGLGGFLES